MIPRRVATVAGDPAAEARLAGSLATHAEFELVLRCVERGELLGAIRGGRLDAVVSAGLPAWVDHQVVDEARRRSCPVIVVGEDEPDRLRALGLRRAEAEAGPDELLALIDRADAPVPPEATSAGSPTGRLVAVWGAKGAPGRTTIALELAAELAATEPATLLVDGDPYGGDVLQLAGIVEELGNVIWAARMAAKEELSGDLLAGELRRTGARGPVVLPGLPRGELWAEVSDFGWRRLLVAARASFRFTVCDVGFCLEPDASPYPEAGEGRNRMARVTVAEADRVVAVLRADAVGIKQFLWGCAELRALVDLDDVIVVANRVEPGGARAVGDLVKRHLGKRPTTYVPDRPEELQRAVAAGKTVRETRPRSEVTGAIRSLAASLGGDVAPRGLLLRLAGRGGA